VRIALSTLSRRNRDAGFDARIRLGVINSLWHELPPPGVRKAPPFDYSTIEGGETVSFRELAQAELELLIIDKLKRAEFIQAWGDLYLRTHVGVHQVHSRRASSAVPIEYIGRDGALKLFFRDGQLCETLLFKFAGQP
jgi:hypothetical protein